MQAALDEALGALVTLPGLKENPPCAAKDWPEYFSNPVWDSPEMEGYKVANRADRVEALKNLARLVPHVTPEEVQAVTSEYRSGGGEVKEWQLTAARLAKMGFELSEAVAIAIESSDPLLCLKHPEKRLAALGRLWGREHQLFR